MNFFEQGFIDEINKTAMNAAKMVSTLKSGSKLRAPELTSVLKKQKGIKNMANAAPSWKGSAARGIFG